FWGLNLSKVILSYPYSGAIQAFFAKELVGKSFGANHSYYETLWGKNAEDIITFSLTLFTVYDEVIFSPVDNPLPDSETRWGDEEYYHPDFGLRMPSRIQSMGFDYIEHQQYVDWLIAHQDIVQCLDKVPVRARLQILSQVICDIELSLQHGAEVVTSVGRRALMKKICELDPQYKNAEALVDNTVEPLKFGLDLLLPDFELTSIDFLHRVKSDKQTRIYGRSVTNILRSGNQYSEEDFYKLAQEHNIKNSKNQSINRFSSVAGKVFSVLGFTPVIGPLFSSVSLAMGESQRLTNLSNSNWLEFKPHLAKLKTSYDIEKVISNKN
ncbi:TPA: hypothetical protein ACOL2D_004827, partial [Vibrio parahaemolyticus]